MGVVSMGDKRLLAYNDKYFMNLNISKEQLANWMPYPVLLFYKVVI